MSFRRRTIAILALLLTALLSGACSDADGDAAADTPTDETATTDTGNADGSDGGSTDDGSGDDGSEGSGSTDTSVIPADENGADICEALTGEMVSEAIGTTVSGTDGYGLGTPQCSYSFDDEGTITTVSVAAQRTDEDLGGLTGRDALELAVSANEAMVENEAESSEVSIEGAEAAVAIDGKVISGVIVLADSGQVYTVFSPALDPGQHASLATAAVAALS
jgi:hypothetical protein